MFGASAPRIRRRVLGLDEQQPESLGFPMEKPAPRGPMTGRLFGGSAPAIPQQPAPMPQEPAKTPPMGMMMQGPKRELTGIQQFGRVLSALGGDIDGFDKRVEGRWAAEDSRNQLNAQIQSLKQSGFSDAQIVAFINNPEEWSKSLATNLEAANVDGGNSRVYGDGRKAYTAPKFGVDGGRGYTQTPEGTDWGDRRGMSYGEENDAAKTAEDIRNNNMTNARGWAGINNDRDRLAFDKTKPSSGGGLTPYQGLNFQFKLDDLDRELADKERSRKTSLATVDGSIALLDKFTGGGATFNDVYGNWINPTGEGNDLFNPRVQPGSPRANGTAILEQLGGRAFLDSIQAMRGTGPLSDREGARVTAAATRLTNVTQSDEAATEAATEFRAALEAYKAALEQDMATSRESEATRRNRMEAMMGVAAGSPAAASPVDDLSDLLEKYK